MKVDLFNLTLQLLNSLLSYIALNNSPHIFNGRQVWTAGCQSVVFLDVVDIGLPLGIVES